MSATIPAISWLVTAEHASNAVPERWRSLFVHDPGLLHSHRAWDPGSAELARALAVSLDAPLLEGRITRLLVDLNRSANHPRRFSELSKALPAADRDRLVGDYWQPHWDRYRRHLEQLPGRIVHVACHSFTPVLDGRVRSTDIGLLYDPSRPIEAAFCRALGARLCATFPELRIHMNSPYRGISNGMGQQHRRLFPDRRLITFEIEINQRLLGSVHWRALLSGLARQLAS
ncbi:MAG: N-formylglutamate amidohydrolase [Wenzhouxiangellaceae bacterium]|nr:N-formylglutamate amidohydrolase [Wenzhouxiangellaceae bacterium]